MPPFLGTTLAVPQSVEIERKAKIVAKSRRFLGFVVRQK
jgi:hypothetical protein